MALQARGRHLAAGVLTLLGSAAHAECPDIDAALLAAEQDVVAYFLADAQVGLDTALLGFGCAPGTARQRARYWQAQAMVWSFEGDDRADAGFAAAKRDDAEWFAADFGDDARARWEAATLPSGPGLSLVVKGMGPAERVWVDGQVVEGTVSPGLHLLQVGNVEPRVARVFPALTGTVTLSVPDLAPAPVEPEPSPEPVELPAPTDPEPAVASVPVPEPAVEPGPVEPGPAPGVAPAPEPVEPVSVPPEPSGSGGPVAFVGPLDGMGRRTVDARGNALHWRRDVIRLAEQRADGMRAVRRLRGNTWRQVSSGAILAGGGYATYLLGWEALVGKSSNPQVINTGLILSASVSLLGASSLLKLRRDRAKLRQEVRLEAARALEAR